MNMSKQRECMAGSQAGDGLRSRTNTEWQHLDAASRKREAVPEWFFLPFFGIVKSEPEKRLVSLRDDKRRSRLAISMEIVPCPTYQPHVGKNANRLTFGMSLRTNHSVRC